MSEEIIEESKSAVEVELDTIDQLYLTVKEVATILRTSEMSVLALVKSFQLETLNFSASSKGRGRVLIEKTSFLNFLDRNTTESCPSYDSFSPNEKVRPTKMRQIELGKMYREAKEGENNE